MTAIAPHMTFYLRDYLAKQKDASPYTRETYAYSFQLLFNFASEKLKLPPSSIELEQIDAPLITDFLEYIEITKGVCIAAVIVTNSQPNLLSGSPKCAGVSSSCGA